MCLLGYIACFVFGIIALVQGKLTLSRTWVIVGRPAYVLGAMLIAAFPCVAVLTPLLMWIVTAAFGRFPNPGALALWIELVVGLSYMTLIFSIAFALSRPTAHPRQSSAPQAVSALPTPVEASNRAVVPSTKDQRLSPPPTLEPADRTASDAHVTAKLGPSSLVLSVVAGVFLLALFVIAAILARRPGGMRDDSLEAVAVGCLLFLGLGTQLVAFGLGLAAMIQSKRIVVAALLGVIFSVVVSLLFTVMLILGLVTAGQRKSAGQMLRRQMPQIRLRADGNSPLRVTS